MVFLIIISVLLPNFGLAQEEKQMENKLSIEKIIEKTEKLPGEFFSVWEKIHQKIIEIWKQKNFPKIKIWIEKETSFFKEEFRKERQEMEQEIKKNFSKKLKKLWQWIVGA